MSQFFFVKCAGLFANQLTLMGVGLVYLLFYLTLSNKEKQILITFSRSPNCCDAIHQLITRIFHSHWTWCTFVNRRAVSVWVRVVRVPPLGTPRRLYSPWPTRTRARHAMEFASISIDPLRSRTRRQRSPHRQHVVEEIPTSAESRGARAWTSRRTRRSQGIISSKRIGNEYWKLKIFLLLTSI